jgi:hypothetical protein
MLGQMDRRDVPQSSPATTGNIMTQDQIDILVKSTFVDIPILVTQELTNRFVREYLEIVHGLVEKQKEIDKALENLEQQGFLDSKKKKPIGSVLDDEESEPSVFGRVTVYFRRSTSKGLVL